MDPEKPMNGVSLVNDTFALWFPDDLELPDLNRLS